MMKLPVVATLAAAVVIALLCGRTEAHSGHGELFELLVRVDLNSDWVISAEEVG